MQYLVIWHISLIIVSSRFTNVTANGRISLVIYLLLNFILFKIFMWILKWMDKESDIYTHLPADTLVCFLVTVNNIAINIEVQIFLWDPYFISFRWIPQSGIIRSHLVLFLIFWGIAILFYIMILLIYIPTKSVEAFHFSTTLTIFITFWFSSSQFANHIWILLRLCKYFVHVLIKLLLKLF